MTNFCIKFDGAGTRETASHLIIEYFKNILYYRGQFPLPLDQMLNSITQESNVKLKIDDHPVYVDDLLNNSNSGSSQPSFSRKDRSRQKYEDSLHEFESFFKHLTAILSTNEDVQEVVLNLGTNMMSPKELHRIRLPVFCAQCSTDNPSTPYHKSRLKFFKTVMRDVRLLESNLSSLLPISVLLLLKSGVPLSEDMEQKRFYSTPTNCSQVVTLQFDGCACKKTEEKHEGLWVKLKANLKGVKDCQN